MALKFTGDIQLWLALTLGVLAAGGAWALYVWEWRNRRRDWRFILLPLLRALAVFTIVFTLAGPVLSEERDVSQKSRVLVFVDASASMATDDRYLPLDQKILIALEHGWVDRDAIDLSLLQIGADMHQLRDATAEARRPGSPAEVLHDGCATLATGSHKILERLRDSRLVIASTAQRYEEQIVKVADELANRTIDKASQISVRSRLVSVAHVSADFETQLRDAFRQQVQNSMSNPKVAEAIKKCDGASRWERAESLLLRKQGGLLEDLRAQHEVEVIQLGRNAESAWDSAGGGALPISLPGRPQAAATDLATGIDVSVSRVRAAESGSTTAVLLSDGRNNTGPSPADFAKTLAARRVPLYAIGLGDEHNRPDVAVIGARHNEVVFHDNRVQGIVLLQDDMPPGLALAMTIEHEGQVLWKKELSSEGSGVRRVAFEFSVEAAVAAKLASLAPAAKDSSLPLWMEVRVAPVAGEDRSDNNSRPLCVVKAAPRAAHILIVDRPRWEARYIRNLFARDPNWKTNAAFTSNEAQLRIGDAAGTFPSSKELLFTYDLVVFGDVKPATLADEQLIWLREFVQKRGGGIIFIDGQRHALATLAQRVPAGEKNAPIREMLPVSLETASGVQKAGQFQLTEQGAAESFLALASGIEANMNAWRNLDSPHWAAAAKVQPGADVLLELVSEGEHSPALVSKRFGSGQVLYAAFDESWRFRRELADEYHQRYWNQLANAVMERPFVYTDDRVSLDLSSLVTDASLPASIRVRLRNPEGTPLLQAKASAVIERDGQSIADVPLTADSDSGLYRAPAPALAPGKYQLGVRTSAIEFDKLTGRLTFVVLPAQSPENLVLAANPQLLEETAANSGGKYIAEENAHLLPALLKPMSVKRVVVSEYKLWRSYWWFVPIVALLALEMMFRKRAGLL